MHRILPLILALVLLPCIAGASESYPTPTPLPGYTLRPSNEEVRVYGSMSTKANIVGYIIPGGSQTVHVLSVQGDWCYVAFSSIYGVSYGYIPLSCFDIAAKTTPTPLPEATFEVGTTAWISNFQEGYRLNLRKEPTYSSTSLGKYYTGTPVTLTGEVQNGFVRVLLADSVLGWIDLRYITLDSSGFVPEMPIVTISNPGGALLRTGPGTNYSRITRCSYGSAVVVMGVCSNGWYHVRVDDHIGYMSETVLSGTFPYGYGMDSDNPALEDIISDRESVFYINTRSANGLLNLRKSASSSAKSLGKFHTGTPVIILNYTRSGWAYVRIGQTEGYMDIDYLSPTKPAQFGVVRVIRNPRANGMNLRSMPSTGGEILAFAPNYSQVTLLGELTDGWCYVKYGDITGYMLGTYLTPIN